MTACAIATTFDSAECQPLDYAAELFQSPDPYCPMEGIRVLRDAMHSVRQEFAHEASWRRFIANEVRPHRVLKLAHQDPFLSRAYDKPRGYAGDAVLLDFIYHHPANRRYIDQSP